MSFKANFVDTSVGTPFTRVVESADPADLATRVQNCMRNNAGPRGTPTQLMVYNLQLAGGGQGASFVVLMSFIRLDAIDGTSIDPAEAQIVGYEAGDAIELPKAREAALAAAAARLGPAIIHIDEPVEGASDGSKFLGLAIFST